jgi:hypothetical protein
MTLQDTIKDLNILHTERRLAMTMQRKANQVIDSAVVNKIHHLCPDAKRTIKQMFVLAGQIRKAHEKRQVVPGMEPVHEAAFELLSINHETRERWDGARQGKEHDMGELAHELPVSWMCADISGFSYLGLATIVAEAGDLSKYPTKDHLFKRLGLACIDGHRQGVFPKTGLSTAEINQIWLEHGYNPRRRSAIWTVVYGLMMQQLRGGAHGPYGQIYAERKALYMATAEDRSWATKGLAGHCDNAARRYVGKCLIRDLRREWIVAVGWRLAA